MAKVEPLRLSGTFHEISAAGRCGVPIFRVGGRLMRDPVSAITHAIGFLASIVVTIELVFRAHRRHVSPIPFAIFGAGMVL